MSLLPIPIRIDTEKLKKSSSTHPFQFDTISKKIVFKHYCKVNLPSLRV